MSIENQRESEIMSIENQPTTYVVQFCGVSNGYPEPSGAGAVLLGADRNALHRFRWGLGCYQTVIAAQYHGLILAMRQAISKGYKNIIAEGDSERIVLQVKGFEYAHEPIRCFWMMVLDLKKKFHSFDIQLIPRVQNSLAEAQANQAVHNVEEGRVQEDDLVA